MLIKLQGRLCKYFALMASDVFDGSILLLLRLILTQHPPLYVE